MVSYGLSRKFFDYKFKVDEATSIIFSGLFFHMSINIAAKFIVYRLNINEDIEPVPNTRFHGNFLNFALF